MSEVTVRRIADAQVGDRVWLLEPDRPRYVDGKYIGRGAYTIVTIDDRNKASFIVGHTKYDAKTGEERSVRIGYPSILLGIDDREDNRWQSASRRIADAVVVASTDQLKRIAEIVGFTLDDVGA